jgi:hypothetical protein
MKRALFLIIAPIVLLMTSCDTTKEISIREDGSGTIVNTNDMSGLMGLAKMGGAGAEKMGEMAEKPIDTTIDIGKIVDSLDQLTPGERTLLKNGKLGFALDMKNDKAIVTLTAPFTEMDHINKLERISSRIALELVGQQMAKGEEKLPPGMGMPKGSIDDYFITTYSKGVLERKLDKEKYAKIGEDEDMQAVKELAAMGMGNTKIIFNLPSPAKKTEGKALSLSDDKKVVTVMTSMEEFFSNAESLTFRIEY